MAARYIPQFAKYVTWLHNTPDDLCCQEPCLLTLRRLATKIVVCRGTYPNTGRDQPDYAESKLNDNTTPREAVERAAELRRAITEANYNYYVLDQPTISDSDYDRLMRELTDLEERFPALVSPESPTQRVGAAPQTAFATHNHRQPMLSLSNTFSEEELRAFDSRIRPASG